MLVKNTPSLSWNTVPAEILYYSLRHLEDQPVLFQCQFVCKAWREPAQRVAYKTIRLHTYAGLARLVLTLKETRGLGKVIKHLHFHDTFIQENGGPWDPEDYFSKISKYCPNVNIMTNSHSCDSLWLRLIMERNKWTHIKSIPRPQDEEGIDGYTAAAIALRDRLTHLCLYSCFEGDDNSREYSYLELKEKLSEFVKLNHLEIRKLDPEQVYVFDELLDQCPKLSKLDITLLPSLDDITDNNRRDDMTTMLADPPSHATLDLIENMKPKTGIKELKGFIPLREDETLMYIMQAFSNLSTMELNISTKSKALSDMRVVNGASVPSNLTAFLCYLLDIPNHQVRHMYIEWPGIALTEYWNSAAYKTKRCHDGVFLFISNSIVEHENRPYWQGDDIPSIGVASTHPTIEITFPANGSEFHLSDLIEDTGLLVTDMEIDVSMRIPTNKEQRENMCGYYLDHIFKHCHSLRSLTWYRKTLLTCNPEASINTSIDQLTIKNSPINTNILSQLSVRLPSLQTLSLNQYKFIKFDGTVIKSRHTSIDMPYTKFYQLILVEDKSVRPQNFANVFIKYSDANGDTYRQIH